MKREDIIKLAREAGCKPFRSPAHWDDVQVFSTPDVLERFAALVAHAANTSQERVDEIVKQEHDRAVELAQAYERGWNAALAQQEPVAWVGLTDEEIEDLIYLYQKIDASNSPYFYRRGFARAIEAKLRDKNI